MSRVLRHATKAIGYIPATPATLPFRSPPLPPSPVVQGARHPKQRSTMIQRRMGDERGAVLLLRDHNNIPHLRHMWSCATHPTPRAYQPTQGSVVTNPCCHAPSRRATTTTLRCIERRGGQRHGRRTRDLPSSQRERSRSSIGGDGRRCASRPSMPRARRCAKRQHAPVVCSGSWRYRPCTACAHLQAAGVGKGHVEAAGVRMLQLPVTPSPAPALR